MLREGHPSILFVSLSRHGRRTDRPDLVHGRSMPSVQIGPILEPKAPLARELMLSQNVRRVFQSSSALLSLIPPPFLCDKV
jgi:hypothetical protein